MKKLLNLLMSLSLPIATTLTIVSCSKNEVDTSQILIDGINSGDVVAVIDNETQDKIKITEFKDFKFKWEVNPNILDSDKDYAKSLKKAINDNPLSYNDFLIPKLNDDVNSRIIFKLKEEKLFVDFNGIKIRNNDNTLTSVSEKIQNLTDVEIKDLINEKLFEKKNFINDLISAFKLWIVKPFNEAKISNSNLTFNDWWNKWGNNKLVQDKLKNWFLNNFSFFNNSYKNVVIKNLQVNENGNSIEINFELRTSEQSTNFFTLYEPIKLNLI